MKKLILVALFVFASATLSSAQVSVPSPFSLYASGAISVPTSPSTFKEIYKTGLHGSIGVGFKLAPNFQAIGKIEYHQFKLDGDGFADATGITGVTDGTNRMLMFGVDGRFSLGLPAAPIKPFILGGIGIARLSQTEYSGTNTLATSTLNSFLPASQSKVYFNIGGGADLASGPAFSLFAQIRYVSIATSDGSSAFIPISLGIKFF